MQFKAGQNSDPNVIKLGSGESIVGVLRGDPYEYTKKWDDNPKPTFKFRLNMIVKDSNTNELAAKILEGGWKLYNQLKDLQNAGWVLEKTFLKISRQGTGMQTVYSATCIPDGVLSGDKLAKVEAVKLLDLKTNIQDESSFAGDSEDIPF